ncbi:MarR family EPS-associated transcriptional regulator [Porticoccaceae bacterium]|nr:MarR family EPS-associated transcriptional regulator [Porticoccaceae bacterium]
MNLSNENTLQALKLLEKNPELTQRELAAELGLSLGKTHYMVKALIDIGWIKLDNFQRSNNKWGYAYLLTPMGLAEKAAMTVRFLARKQEEYRQLERQIAVLSVEVASMKHGADGQ